MMIRAALLFAVGLTGSVVAQPVQWRLEDGGNGHWYQLIRESNPVDWHLARDAAISRAGHLATITTPAEDIWVRDHVVAFGNIGAVESGPWLGGTCEGNPWGNWRWITGEPWAYAGWANGEPNNGGGGSEYYVQMYNGSSFDWNDNRSDGRGSEFTYLIEWDDDCNRDGIVDKGQILSGQLADANGDGIPDVCEIQAPPVEWTQRVAGGPSPRHSHAMAFDADSDSVVLCGGIGIGGQVGDAWNWNGTAWSLTQILGARSGHAIAYDVFRHVTVLFGGLSGGGFDGQTLEWDGISWAQRPVSGPEARGYHAMAYDTARGVTILFGGSTRNSGISGETWEWDGVSWIQRTVTGPSPRIFTAMAYDSTRQVSVLFGGGTGASGDLFNAETWEWDGVIWTQRHVAGPSPRNQHAMVYDVGRHVVVLFGGYGGSSNASDTWEWNGSVWFQRMINGPTARQLHSMAYDDVRGKTVLFGGFVGGGNYSGETWELGPPCSAPSITSHPTDARLVPGLAVHFEIAATNPVSYQWRRNSTAVSNSARISGATANVLNIAGVQSSDQGFYDCVVTNSCGTVTSNTAELSCKAIITQHPLGGTLAAGQMITLTGAATSGGTTTYRWKKDGVNLFNSTVYQGATTPTLAIVPTDPSNSGNYALAITNTCGTTTTQSALVTVFCSADFNNDGGIDFFDYLDFVDAFSSELLSADFNGDGGIDFFDYLDFVDRFSIGC